MVTCSIPRPQHELTLQKVSDKDGGARAGVARDEVEGTEHALLDQVVVAACDIG